MGIAPDGTGRREQAPGGSRGAPEDRQRRVRRDGGGDVGGGLFE